jgi:hypothetical protein
MVNGTFGVFCSLIWDMQHEIWKGYTEKSTRNYTFEVYRETYNTDHGTLQLSCIWAIFHVVRFTFFEIWTINLQFFRN